jgi:hypothetical protein
MGVWLLGLLPMLISLILREYGFRFVCGVAEGVWREWMGDSGEGGIWGRDCMGWWSRIGHG